MTKTDWHSFDYELKYRIGEITLGRKRLSVLRRVYSLGEIIDGTSDDQLPPLAETQQGYLLANVPRPSTTGAISHNGDLLQYCLQSYQRCYIDMSGSFEDYQNKFSGKTRSGIKRKIRKFIEHANGLDFRTYTTPDEITEFFALARPVSATTYQERLLDCGLPADPEFITQARKAAENDEIRAFILCASGEPVSYLYCPVVNGTLVYAYLGYTPDIAKLSPGTVLQWLALEGLFAERRFTAFDFTEGESEHKHFFSTHQIPCSTQLLLRPTLGGRFSARAHRSMDAASGWLGTQLERHGLKSRIKKWLRKAA